MTDEQNTAPDLDGDETEVQSETPEDNAVEPLAPEEANASGYGEQDAATSHAVGFDPNAPVATSPPPPEAQTGTPTLPDEASPAYPHHTEAGTVDGDHRADALEAQQDQADADAADDDE